MMDRPQSVMDHLQELRRRIVYSLIAIVVAVGVAVAYSHQIFLLILETGKSIPNVVIVQNTLGDTFLTEFRLAIIAGLVIAFPVVLYQIVAFVLPALMPGERRILFMGLPFATLLFLVGWFFGWFVVLPITRTFFIEVATDAGVTTHLTPGAYVDFVLGICNPLGLAFELPLVVLILARIGLISSGFLGRIRKFAFLALLLLAAVLSPPDVISMSIFMVPLYGLYEVSILLARLVERKRT